MEGAVGGKIGCYIEVVGWTYIICLRGKRSGPAGSENY